MNANETKVALKHLEDIRNILILIANKSGVSQPQIGKVLGVDARTVRKWLSPKER